MWNAYSASYIRHNKTDNRFVVVISFLSSMLLSLVSGVFYNFWIDQVQQTIDATGSSQVETTPAIIAYIVVFTAASIALIMMLHHAFAVTMTSRIHQLGILQSVGATPRQIQSALVNEVVVLSLPAVIIGNLIGIVLCWGFMAFIIGYTADMRDYILTFSYSPIVLLGSLFFSLLTAAVSAWVPARKLSRITPLDAIHYGNEPTIKRVKRYRISSAIFGIHGELAHKSLYARRKSMRIGTLSILLAVFSCISLLNMFGISNLSTQKTYFDRFRDKWDFLITAENAEYSQELLQDIRDLDGVESCIVHHITTSTSMVSSEFLSDEVLELGLENLNDSFSANESGTYRTQTPIYILDDASFEAYRGSNSDAQIVAVNIIWDSIHSERTAREYVPFLNSSKDISLELSGTKISISEFAQELPVLREELYQYSLTLVMSESYYKTAALGMPAEEIIFTIRITGESINDTVETQLQQLLTEYPDYALEGRLEEEANEVQIQQGLRFVIYMFTGLMACIGLANVFASTLGQIHQRKREFARYFALGLTPKGAAKILTWEAAIVALRPILLTILVNIPLMALMLDAGGISSDEFIVKRLPLVPAIIFFAAIIGFVALAYYLGGRKICNMNLVDTIKDDTLAF